MWKTMSWSLLALLLFCFGMTSDVRAEKEVDISIIIAIESSGNSKAISYRGAKYGRGLCQVSEICLAEWNNYHPKEEYTIQDLFDPEINVKIANWYLNKRIPQMLRYFKKEVCLRNILISYNAGINYVVKNKKLRKETIDYIKKYEKRQKERR